MLSSLYIRSQNDWSLHACFSHGKLCLSQSQVILICYKVIGCILREVKVDINDFPNHDSPFWSWSNDVVFLALGIHVGEYRLWIVAKEKKNKSKKRQMIFFETVLPNIFWSSTSLSSILSPSRHSSTGGCTWRRAGALLACPQSSVPHVTSQLEAVPEGVRELY